MPDFPGWSAAQISNPYINYGQYTQKIPVSTINNVSQIPGESGRTVSHAPAAARTGPAPLPDWLKPIASGRQDAVMARLGNLKHSERTRLECSHLYSPEEIRTADRAPFECARKYLQANELGAHEAAVLEERFRGAERVRDVCRVLDLPITKAHGHAWLVRDLEKSLSAYLKKANGKLDATWKGGLSCSFDQFEKMERNLEKLLKAIGKDELRSQLITQLEPALLDRIQKLHPDCCITEIYGDLGKFVNTESVVKLGGKICDGNAMDVLREIDKILVYLDPAQPAANGGDPVPGRPSAAPLVPNQIGNQNQSYPYPPIIIHGAKAKAGHIITHDRREHSSDVERKLDKLIELIEKAPGAASAETAKVGFDQPPIRRADASTQVEALPAKATSEMQTQTEEAQQLPPDAYPFRREDYDPDATWMLPPQPPAKEQTRMSAEMQTQTDELADSEDLPPPPSWMLEQPDTSKQQAPPPPPPQKASSSGENPWDREKLKYLATPLAGLDLTQLNPLKKVERKEQQPSTAEKLDGVPAVGSKGWTKKIVDRFDDQARLGSPLVYKPHRGKAKDQTSGKINLGLKASKAFSSESGYTSPSAARQNIPVDQAMVGNEDISIPVTADHQLYPRNTVSKYDHTLVRMDLLAEATTSRKRPWVADGRDDLSERLVRARQS